MGNDGYTALLKTRNREPKSSTAESWNGSLQA